MRLIFGRVKSQSKGRISVILPGFLKDVTVDALALVGGQDGVQTWASFNTGDLVAVLMDEEHPENAVVLGGVWTDSGVPASAEKGEVAVRASKVSAFKSTPASLSSATRDDRLQQELAHIKGALDALVNAFNTHLHSSPAGATSAPTIPATNQYTVGKTASDVVFIE